MAVPFNDPNFSKPLDWWVYNNEITQGWWGHFLLIIVFVVTYVYLDKRESAVAFAGSLFFTMVIAMLLWFMELIPLGDVYIGLVLFAISLVANLWRNRGY